MRSFLPYPAIISRIQVNPALAIFANECLRTLGQLTAYVGALALLAIAGLYAWGSLVAGTADEPSARPIWSLATRSYPAFAVSQFDSPDATEIYEIFRHPEGGRRDVIRWALPGEGPLAELEIYRPGGEFAPAEPAAAEPAAGMSPEGAGRPEAAGVLGSKFGKMALFRNAGGPQAARSCLGFIRQFDHPALQISGWSCQGDTLPARRAAIGCMLNRLVLLSAGNDPKLAEFFARAELKRGSCVPAAPSAAVDWVTRAESPGLRGGF
jgi:hypothetical protein